MKVIDEMINLKNFPDIFLIRNPYIVIQEKLTFQIYFKKIILFLKNKREYYLY